MYNKRLEAKTIYEEEDGTIHCPHCHRDITIQYENADLEVIDSLPIVTIKDPCFAECSHSQTLYLKCPYCSSTIEDEASWDN